MQYGRHSGYFISFEGSEGCGKSTQIGLLVECLSSHGLDPLLVREPGGTPIGEMIRHLLQHAPEGRVMMPETELLLFAASRAQLVRETILPALDSGRIVISDRFLDSTTVYQGVARQIPSSVVAEINGFAVGPRLPDATFVLDMDASTAMRRLRDGRGPSAPSDRMEQQPADFYEAVRAGYLSLAEEDPERIQVLDASAPREQIANQIVAHLKTKNHALFQRICA